MSRSAYAPMLIGTVALDFLHRGPLGAGLPPAFLRWGGVMNNVACAMGARGDAPVLVTADYAGELRAAVCAHLAANAVTWSPLAVRTPLPVFHAELVDGSVAAKHFLGADALDLLTPERLAAHPGLLDRASVLVAGTDGSEQSLAWLCDTARERGVPFWLLSADPTEVHKLRPQGRAATLVALNRRELSLWAGSPLSGRADLERAARALAGPLGRCLVTLGAGGVLLVPGDPDRPVVFEPADPVAGHVVTVGAGDVLFACLLGARLASRDWRSALARATALTAAYLRELQVGDQPYRALRPPAAAPY